MLDFILDTASVDARPSEEVGCCGGSSSSDSSANTFAVKSMNDSSIVLSYLRIRTMAFDAILSLLSDLELIS